MLDATSADAMHRATARIRRAESDRHGRRPHPLRILAQDALRGVVRTC